MGLRGRKRDDRFDKAIVEGVNAGLTVAEIAEKVGVSCNKLSALVYRMGGAKRLRGGSSAVVAKYAADVRALAAGGKSRREIAERLQLSYSTVASIIRAENIDVVDLKSVEAKATFDHAAAVAAVNAGRNMSDVAQQYGVSRERIRQIVRRAGVVPETGWDFRQGLREQVRDFVLEGYSDAAIAEMLDLSEAAVKRDRRAAGLREANRLAFARELVRREMQDGKSIRQICLAHGINDLMAQRLAKEQGFVSKFGRHRDLSARAKLFAEWRQEGLSWADVSERLSAADGRPYCAGAAYAWAQHHAPHLTNTGHQ